MKELNIYVKNNKWYNIFHHHKLLPIFGKSSISDVWQGSEYTSALTQSQWMFSSDFNVDFEQVLAIPHPVFTCSKLTIETLEKGVKYV